MPRPVAAASAAVSVLALSACGGVGAGAAATASPSSAGTPPLPEVERVLIPDNTIIVAGDYLGRTFPLLFASRTEGATKHTAAAGLGSMEVVDDETIIVRLPGAAPLTFDPQRRLGSQNLAAELFADAAGNGITIQDKGFARTAGTGDFLDDAAGLHGAFGFEPRVGQRPVSARYNGASSSAVALLLDGADRAFTLRQASGTDLTAVFTGSGGTISGTLINTSERGSFGGDPAQSDRVLVNVSLDGTITLEGFTGTVNAVAALALGGGPAQDLGLAVSSSQIVGKFFGQGAETASGAWTAEGTVALPGASPAGAALHGHFWAENTIRR
jgi:hypothetical protein